MRMFRTVCARAPPGRPNRRELLRTCGRPGRRGLSAGRGRAATHLDSLTKHTEDCIVMPMDEKVARRDSG